LNNDTTITIQLDYHELNYTVKDNSWHNLRFEVPSNLKERLPLLIGYSITVPKNASPVVLYYFGIGEKAMDDTIFLTPTAESQQLEHSSRKNCTHSLQNVKKLPSIDLAVVESQAFHISASKFESRISGPLEGFVLMPRSNNYKMILESTSYFMIEKNYILQVISLFEDYSYYEFNVAYVVTFRSLVGRKTYTIVHTPSSMQWENNIFDLPEAMFQSLPAMYAMKIETLGYNYPINALYHVGIGDRAAITCGPTSEKSTTDSSRTTLSTSFTQIQTTFSKDDEASPQGTTAEFHLKTTPEINPSEIDMTSPIKTTLKSIISTRPTTEISTTQSTQDSTHTMTLPTTPMPTANSSLWKRDWSGIMAKFFQNMGLSKIDLNLQFLRRENKSVNQFQ
jgi:hypothetical protein